MLVAAGIASVAAAQASSATGFYAGASAGVANTNVKYSFVSQSGNGQTIDSTKATQNFKTDAGKMAGLFGVFAGYGMGFAQGAYVGGEIYGGFDSTKVKAYDDSASTLNGFWTSTVKRTNYYGVAFRLGYMLTPSTLGYVRLGVEGGKWKAQVVPVSPSSLATIATTGTGTNSALQGITNTASKSSVSFAPGLGFETFLNKNLFLRAEYSYLFGPKITINANTSGYANAYLNGGNIKHEFKITQHAFKIGVGYKF